MTEANGHVEGLLDRYRTGELDAAGRRRVEAHLEGCEGCRSALADLEAFATTVERAYAAEATARAAEREPDWGRLRAAIVGRTSARKHASRRSWLARHAPQTAVAVVAVVALGVVWQQGIRGPEDAERALQSERPAALSDRDASPAERSAAASRPQSPEPATTARTEPDRVQPAQDEGPVRKGEAAEPLGDELENREGARQQKDARPTAQKPAPAGEAIGGKADAAAAGARDDSAVSRARFEARADSNVVADEPAPVVGEIAVTGQNEAASPPDLERFQRRARVALSEADSALAADALAQWRDSLASGDDLPTELRRAAEALADSLAAFLATRP
ncbi:MAG: zf-HC2 domain-containing protein [Gemmatimonadota bacterium]